MGKTRVRIEMDDEQRILLKRSLNKNGEGQSFLHMRSEDCVSLMSQI